MDRAKKCLAVLGRIIGIKKRKPERDTEVLVDTKADIKFDAETNAEVNTKVACCACTCHGPEAHTAPKRKSTLGAKNGWVYRPNYEFPWRLAQVVEEEDNWRGTWVLEVKDLQAMDWGTTRVPKTGGHGRGGRYERQPTRHMPFPVDGVGYRETLTGGQDDLMVMLGRR
ncbi:hypothetical protein GCG54_00006488 [Colletotrichum gloeosporioides]|uniref:Uncharacterized protein n=1 Tax=Colletotrichum gloeosporioides TaxID=474922 RepID=A0A8H4FNH1_COLGL|nr:uncharacterized protein GCG54_00006488 [Colletotrichum gloeosporioides]KAF3808622.1 hypothetical protein GCG54_00006488 [Colletotrichum gloeosporioides]